MSEKFQSYYEARDFLIDIMEKDLFGPVNPEEILSEFPTQYYILGKLYPSYGSLDYFDTARSTGVESETDTYDAALATANMRNPSSMGVTFALKPNVSRIKVMVTFAIYESLRREDLPEDIKKKLEPTDEDTSGDLFWIRKAKVKEYPSIDVNDFKEDEIIDRVFFKLYPAKCGDDEKVITAVLVNERDGNNKVSINQNTVFQPSIVITAIDDTEPHIFAQTNRQVEIKQDDEALELDMLYRNYGCYGQGHGCSVSWEDENHISGPEPICVKSSFMPQYELLQMEAGQLSGTPVFQMEYLATGNREDIIEKLDNFLRLYKSWIEKQSDEKRLLKEGFKKYADEHIESCMDAYNRIKHAINLLNHNDNVWRTFQLANEVMFLQRYQNQKRKNFDVKSESITWYPFQLAFILQELSSLVESDGDERKIVDLLWFPTGGGKTEAYLGIAAFAIFYRIITRKERCDGVTVIMRYTLRLLTMQQFERASSMICACELLRKKYHLSNKRIQIGLWVGNELTPKNTAKAYSALNKLRVGQTLADDEADPCQLKKCPWCGAELGTENYEVDRVHNKIIVRCPNKKCEYHSAEGLPVKVTDEEIYREKPSFIVATVDKFAQIPIASETSAIFGIDENKLPPDLIIQDELHLISGPLGTMTGIYEAAFINLCREKGNNIKVIASTATIRNAKAQIRALYGRDSKQFPPQGLDVDNSFFARKAARDKRPARYYLGVMASGTSFTTTLIRVYAAWLFASRYLKDLGYEDEVIDNFWTLTGYFNSIRELGGAGTEVVDDVQSRYKHLKGKKFAHLMPEFTGENEYSHLEELTSRKKNSEISDILKFMEKEYVDGVHSDVYDFILASNMISVGVDVGRLGTMAVAGQPKTNSEYIQATSRVGRSNPGLVITIYNHGKSRDRSHYEQFLKYHSALYRYVEATSLTPFSDRARDRGLHTLFVTLCRYLIPDLYNDDAAGNFNIDDPRVLEVEKIILNYVKTVDALEEDAVYNELQVIKREWDEEAHGELYYRKKGKHSLLKEDIEEDERFRTMNSMRSVEKESGVYLI